MYNGIVKAVMVAGAIAAGALLASCSPKTDTAWQTYKQRFVTADGRVIDTGNKNVSHTEGQGYAMLFAVANNDRETFDRIWTWTRNTLRRPDGLYSWRYMPNAENPIADRNNATDGELVMCWALLRASKAWSRPADRDAALNIAAALKATVVEDGANAYLLPGVEGFTGDNKRVVNLSYWVFPALRDIGNLTGDTVWQRVSETGLRLITGARFGEHHLPPDWLETSGDLRPADGFPPRFGYDAIRIPLYLTWAGHNKAADAIAAFWNTVPADKTPPAWIDVATGETSPEPQSPGMTTVRHYTLGAKTGPVDAAQGDYYSTSLALLTQLAERDNGH